ncbi:DUF541 domain-containing protein [Rhodobacteraceae bacterium CCMM004]|nr:DUF541 domain-containing protein [Rhodobacteraceae bacterium CCMM004]
MLRMLIPLVALMPSAAAALSPDALGPGAVAQFQRQIATIAPVAAEPATLTVTGVGRIVSRPDMATVRIGVAETAVSADTAVDAMSTALAEVLDTLDAAGISGDDIQTQGLNLYPQFARDDERGGERMPRITGYVAESDLSVRVLDLAMLGEVLDAAVGVGGNRFGGVGFGLLDPSGSESAARAAAVADAIARAREIAAAAGLTLGPVQAIQEGGAVADPFPRDEMLEMAANRSVPVASGSLTTVAQVTIRFTLTP